jgi:hypothetical protein
MTDGLWVIINLRYVQETDQLWGLSIPPGARPTYVHEKKELAERELARLAGMHPGNEFTLFRAVGKMVPVPNREDVQIYQAAEECDDAVSKSPIA